MSFDESLKKFNDFIFQQCGTTNTLFDHLRLGKPEPVKSIFFKPYQSKSDFFYSTASVFTAPASLALLSLELFTASLYTGLRTVVDLVQRNTQAAKFHGINSIIYMACSFVAAIVAVASPVINLVDLVGGGIATLNQKKEAPEITQPALS